MDFNQAVAILLNYDVMPRSLLTSNQKAALDAASDVVQDHAQRAVSEFVGHESSKKYIAIQDVLTINELHD